MNADAEWLLMELQPIAGIVSKMTIDGATQDEIDAYLDSVNYRERLNAYKTARAFGEHDRPTVAHRDTDPKIAQS